MTKKEVKEALETFLNQDENEKLFQFEKMTAAMICIKSIRDDIIELGQKKFDKEVITTNCGRILATNLIAYGKMLKDTKAKYEDKDEDKEKKIAGITVIYSKGDADSVKKLLKALTGKKKKKVKKEAK